MKDTAKARIAFFNVHLPFLDHDDATALFNVTCKSGRVSSVTKADQHVDAFDGSVLDMEGQGVLIPS